MVALTTWDTKPHFCLFEVPSLTKYLWDAWRPTERGYVRVLGGGGGGQTSVLSPAEP